MIPVASGNADARRAQHTPNLTPARKAGHARDQPQKTRDAMIDIDNTMTRDEAAKPSRRHRPRGRAKKEGLEGRRAVR